MSALHRVVGFLAVAVFAPGPDLGSRRDEFYRMLEGVVIDDTELFNDRLKEWEDFYNFDHPHGARRGARREGVEPPTF